MQYVNNISLKNWCSI